ncbi:hypothetical protein BJ170DRAFT_602013 [Xylariales sp. AK1849]|nr:hypothetical protein BJ170DRAFT_602013 [Xylariales sp. AK1849]
MHGSVSKDPFMCKKLSGPIAPGNVILATTMWELVRPEDGEQREQELIGTLDSWGSMVSKILAKGDL